MFFFFFFNDTATTEIYTLSLHDALPILQLAEDAGVAPAPAPGAAIDRSPRRGDRKSTRLNSSHSQISYAVFCLKKKKNHILSRVPVRQLSFRCVSQVVRSRVRDRVWLVS